MLLKSKRSIAELFNNNLDNGKISDIKKILNRLRDILTQEYRKEIKKERYEIENKKNLSKQEEEEFHEYLAKLVRILDKKEKCHHHDHDHPDYYWIRDIESLFSDIDYYYKPILAKIVFKEDKKDKSAYKIGYKLYESRGDRNKNLSVEQCLDMIKPHLRDIINDHKTTESGEWKIQLNMHINFIFF